MDDGREGHDSQCHVRYIVQKGLNELILDRFPDQCQGKLIYDYSGTVTEGQQFTPEQMYSEQDMGTGASTDETSDAEGMSTSVEGNE